MNSNNSYQSNDGSAFDSIFFPCGAIAFQVSITEVHTSHPRIIINDYFGLHHVLPLNPSWNHFFVSGSYKTNIFFVFPLLYHQSVFVD
jgi:hypothetical protein